MRVHTIDRDEDLEFTKRQMKRLFDENKGLTSSKLGEILDVTEQSVSAWRTGKKLPSPDRQAKIIKHFKLPENYFQRPLTEEARAMEEYSAIFENVCKHPELVPALTLYIKSADSRSLDDAKPADALKTAMESMSKSMSDGSIRATEKYDFKAEYKNVISLINVLKRASSDFSERLDEVKKRPLSEQAEFFNAVVLFYSALCQMCGPVVARLEDYTHVATDLMATRCYEFLYGSEGIWNSKPIIDAGKKYEFALLCQFDEDGNLKVKILQ